MSVTVTIPGWVLGVGLGMVATVVLFALLAWYFGGENPEANP